MSINHFLTQIAAVGLLGQIACREREQGFEDDRANMQDSTSLERLAFVLGWRICFDTLPGLTSS